MTVSLLHRSVTREKQSERRGKVNGLSNTRFDGCINLCSASEGDGWKEWRSIFHQGSLWVTMMAADEDFIIIPNDFPASAWRINQSWHLTMSSPRDDHLICYGTLLTFYFILKENKKTPRRRNMKSFQRKTIKCVTLPDRYANVESNFMYIVPYNQSTAQTWTWYSPLIF